MLDTKQNQNSATADVVLLLKVSFSSLQMSFIVLNVENEDRSINCLEHVLLKLNYECLLQKVRCIVLTLLDNGTSSSHYNAN